MGIEKIEWFLKAIPRAKKEFREYTGRVIFQEGVVFITNAYSLLYAKNPNGFPDGVYDESWQKTAINAPTIKGVIPDINVMTEIDKNSVEAIRLLVKSLGSTPVAGVYLSVGRDAKLFYEKDHRHHKDDPPVINPWFLVRPFKAYFGRRSITGTGGLKAWINKDMVVFEFATGERLVVCGIKMT